MTRQNATGMLRKGANESRSFAFVGCAFRTHASSGAASPAGKRGAGKIVALATSFVNIVAKATIFARGREAENVEISGGKVT